NAGMTVYTFDKDAGGKSACNGPCATNWPPLTAGADSKASGDWTVITRDDGSKQWAYKGKPLYLWSKDQKAGDMTGDGFNGVWHAGGDLRAGLFTIMHNVHVNQYALRKRRQAESSLDGDEETPGGWQIAVRATQSDRVELAEVLVQIGRLPVEQREVLILAAVEELRYEEIAEVLGVPIGTVMSRLSRARDKLRRMNAETPSPLKVVR